MPAGLLNGIRVLDLGSGISGPWCAKILADYGAEVIKVESPGSGDAARRMGPFAGDDPDPEKSLTFLYLNTNKKGVTLDPSSASGRRLLDRLLAEADVLVENYPPARSKELGLDYASLAEVNPQVVVTSITPFGQTGPYRDYQATDIVTYALSGLMYHSGDSDQEPLRNVLDQSFYVAGISAAAATQVALFARLTSGEGQHVDVSAAECLGA
ncbi:MAG: CoA transferase, partial [Chloroflexi bacterium]|nr:CoA transferase [Chloroflexota bacterium]